MMHFLVDHCFLSALYLVTLENLKPSIDQEAAGYIWKA